MRIAGRDLAANIVLHDDINLMVEHWVLDGREVVLCCPWSRICSGNRAYPYLEGKYVTLMGRSRFAAVRFDVNGRSYELIDRPGEIGQDVDAMFHLFRHDGLYAVLNGRFWYVQAPGDPWNVIDLPIAYDDAICHVSKRGSLLCYDPLMRYNGRDNSFIYYERLQEKWIERRAILPSKAWRKLGNLGAEDFRIVATEKRLVVFSLKVWYSTWWSLVDMFDEGKDGRAVLIGDGSEWNYRELGVGIIYAADVLGDEFRALTSNGLLHCSNDRGCSWRRTSLRKAAGSALGLSRRDRFDFGFMRMNEDSILTEIRRKGLDGEWKGSSIVLSKDLGVTFTSLGVGDGSEANRRILSIDFP